MITLPPLSRKQVREVDQIAMEQYRVPGIVLMENAGLGAARVIDSVSETGQAVILCGGGNNGGDGYVVARHLELNGYAIRIVSLAALDRLAGDAKTNAEIAEQSGLEIHSVTEVAQIIEALADADIIIDGMLGTGARGPLRGIYAEAVMSCNASEAKRFALDIPTGMDCDTGETSDPTFKADHTVTFVAPKRGFSNKAAEGYLGVVHVIPIGAPKKLLDSIRKSVEA